MTTKLDALDLTGLGDPDEGGVEMVRPVMPDMAAPHVGPVMGHVSPAPGVDPDYEEFLEWKAWRASQKTNADAAGPQAVGLKSGTVRIIVDESPEMPPTGYPLGLNGVAYIIRPGEAVDVPIGLLEVLQNAITATPIIDNLSRRVTGYRNRPRIPWRYAA